MTIDELVQKLNEAMKESDNETRHMIQDSLLLEYINDESVSAAFDPEGKFWYA